MTTCLVLGAGASLQNALKFHSLRRTQKNPPLDYTFFEKIKQLKIAVPSDLATYANKLPLPNPFELERGAPGMEEFFKELFADFQDAPSRATQRAYNQLVRIYVDVLRTTTDWMATTKPGPVGRLIAWASETDDDVVLITFNHDLVIENEIYKQARLRQRWCLGEGYGEFSKELTISSPKSDVDVFRRHGGDCNHDRRITVLKLHGSLNWYFVMEGNNPTPGQLSGKRRLKLRATPRRSIPEAGISYDGKKTWPVLVPPIYAKELLIRPTFSVVWDEARRAVQRAHRLAFVGYSMPPLDIPAARLFQREAAANKDLAWIDVVNTDPQSASRYGTLLPRTAVRWYPTLDHFENQCVNEI